MLDGKADLFAKGKKASPETAIQLADLLERLGKHPSTTRIRSEFIQRVGVQKGDRVLDVGSGTGVLTREIAPFTGESGHVIGVDPNFRLVETARKLSKEKGITGKVSYCMGEGEVINFSADNAYHVVTVSQLFSHVSDPGQVLYEMIRVTKPGGKIALLDYDFTTLSTSHPDRETTEKIRRFVLENYLVNPVGIRTLPPLFYEFGMENIEMAAWVHLEQDAEGPITRILQEAIEGIAGKEKFSPSVTAAWQEERLKQASQGGYFTSLSYFALYGTKPLI